MQGWLVGSGIVCREYRPVGHDSQLLYCLVKLAKYALYLDCQVIFVLLQVRSDACLQKKTKTMHARKFLHNEPAVSFEGRHLL